MAIDAEGVATNGHQTHREKKNLRGEGEKRFDSCSKAFASGSTALNPGSIVGPCGVRAYGTLPIITF